MLFFSRKRPGRSLATDISIADTEAVPASGRAESTAITDISPLRATLVLGLERTEPNEYQVVLLNTGPATAHDVRVEVVAASGGGEPWRLSVDASWAMLDPDTPVRIPALRTRSSTPGVICNLSWIDIDGRHDERIHTTLSGSETNGTSLTT